MSTISQLERDSALAYRIFCGLPAGDARRVAEAEYRRLDALLTWYISRDRVL